MALGSNAFSGAHLQCVVPQSAHVLLVFALSRVGRVWRQWRMSLVQHEGHESAITAPQKHKLAVDFMVYDSFSNPDFPWTRRKSRPEFWLVRFVKLFCGGVHINVVRPRSGIT